jgi:uncharacterized protein YndB with AHSA1/START domain
MTNLKITAEPGRQDVLISREFDAPRELVFRAYTEPELVKKWWGFDAKEITLEAFEPRRGGQWHFVQHTEEGSYGFYGVFHTVRAPEEITQTFEFDGFPGHVLLETFTFEDLGNGRTLLKDFSVFQSVEDRDGMIESGMEQGSEVSWNRLADLLKTL